jgi:hypothetical protein
VEAASAQKTYAHTYIENHKTSLGDNGSIHKLYHTILLWSVCDGVVPHNAFITIVIIKFI